jgi:hypothetical protein
MKLLIGGLAGLLLCVTSPSTALFVQTPCCSAFPHAGASFGPQLPWTSPGVFGVLSRGEDKECQGGVSGTIVLIDRGLEPFVDTVKACQEKGAVAVVVRNVLSSGGDEGELVLMAAAQKETGVSVPSVFVSRKTGDELDAMLALNPSVFVELFAADDVNSLMAYVAYLMMSMETIFFGVLFMLVLVILGARRNRVNHGRRCCRRGQDDSYTRTALIVNDESLLEPLQPNSSSLSRAAASRDPESKLSTSTTARPSTLTAYPVVFSNGTQQEHSVSVPVDPINDEPVFEQQEQ